MWFWAIPLLLAGAFPPSFTLPTDRAQEVDGSQSRKVLGSSVVTSVSVILDQGNGTQAYFADAVGKPVSKPATASQVASPINLLNPDRYEFFTFNDNGDLVKKVMSIKEIQSIIANNDGDLTHLNAAPEKKVDDVVSNVQNVLKVEMAAHKPNKKPVLDTPDVSQTWSQILPSIFGGNEEMPAIPPSSLQDQEEEEEQTVKSTETPIDAPVETTVKPELITFFSVTPTTEKPTTIKIKEESSSITIIPNSSAQETESEEHDIITIKPAGTTSSTTVHAKTPADSTTAYSKPEASTVSYNAPISTLASKKPAVYITKTPISSTTMSSTSKPQTQDVSTEQDLLGSATNTPSSTTHHITVEESNSKVPTTENIIIITKHEPLPESSTELLKTSASETIRPYTSTVNYRPIIYLLTTTTENDPTILLNTLHTLQSESTTVKTKPITTIKPIEESTKLTQETVVGTSTEKMSTSSIENSQYDEVNDDENDDNSEDVESTINSNEITTSKMEQSGENTSTESQEVNNKENEEANNKENEQQPNIIDLSSTTEYLSVTELLDQLLQSTDIYAINSQLTDTEKFSTTTRYVTDDTESPNALTLQSNESTENAFAKENTESTLSDEITTFQSVETTAATEETKKETSAEPTKIFTTSTTVETPTTNVVQVVEEMIKNSTVPIADAAENTEENGEKVQNLMNSTANKTMDDVKTQAATIASDLIAGHIETTTENKNVPLNDVLSTLISQIVSGQPNIQDIASTTARVEDPILLTTKIAANHSKYRTEVPHDIHVIIYRTTQPTVESKKNNTNDNVITTTKQASFTETNKLESTTTKSKPVEEMIKNATATNELSASTTTKPHLSTESDMVEVPQIINRNKESSEDTISTSTIINKVTTQAPITTIKLEASTTTKVAKPKESTTTAKPISKKTANTDKMKETKVTKTEETTVKNSKLQNKNNTAAVPANSTNKTSNANKTALPLQTHVNVINNKKTAKVGSTTTTNQPSATLTTTTNTIGTTQASMLAANVTKPNQKLNSTNAKIGSTNTPKPVASTPTPFLSTTEESKIVDKNMDKDNSSWTLVSMVPSSSNISTKPTQVDNTKPNIPTINIEPAKPVDLVPQPLQGFGLDYSTSNLDTDIYKFVELCNELAFGFWQSVTNGISSARSVFTSPFAATSLLAMVFLGARGSTSGEMNEILKLDDMVTFNPHLIFRNVTESIESTPSSGVATSAIIRELYSDKGKGKLLNFYKERARQFYDGHVEEASFKEIGDIIRRRTNLLVKRQTYGKIPEYVKDSSLTARPPLAGISASIFQTDCSAASTEGRDGELYFVVLPTIRQRRLIPVPAVVYRSGFLAGYDPGLDATAVALGSKDHTVSTIFVIPGQQGIAAPGDGLARLEKHLGDTAFKGDSWPRLLRSLIPRPGLEVQIPRFSHRSIINATVALQKMGLKDLFDSKKADLRGLNGVAHELHLSDLIQINSFATCGEDTIDDTHHSEIYPATAARPSRKSRYLEEIIEEPRDYQRAFHDPVHDPSTLTLPLSLRPRQARLPEIPRLRFDRPFLYFVRHNPTGLILHMGRFNPRLLP